MIRSVSVYFSVHANANCTQIFFCTRGGSPNRAKQCAAKGVKVKTVQDWKRTGNPLMGSGISCRSTKITARGLYTHFKKSRNNQSSASPPPAALGCWVILLGRQCGGVMECWRVWPPIAEPGVRIQFGRLPYSSQSSRGASSYFRDIEWMDFLSEIIPRLSP